MEMTERLAMAAKPGDEEAALTGASVSAGHNLCLQPDGMRGELPFLFYGTAGSETQSGGWRDCWTDRGRPTRSGRAATLQRG